MPGTPTISFIVPAYNEEANLAATFDSIRAVTTASGVDYEIVAIDDGSADGTYAIAQAAAAGDPNIKAFTNVQNRGLGYTFDRGVREATGGYVMLVPGDNEVPRAAIATLIDGATSVDLTLGYFPDQSERPLFRRILSRTYTTLVNIAVWRNIRYYNGPSVIRRDLALLGVGKSSSFAYMALHIMIALDAGATFREVAVPLEVRKSGKSAALRWRNWVGVSGDMTGFVIKRTARKLRRKRPVR